MRVSSITKNAGKACNNRLYRHIRTFEKIIKNYFVISSQICIPEAGDLHSRPPASLYSSTGSASREQYRRVSISRPVYGATMPSTRGAPAGFSPRAFTSRPSVSHASPTPL